MTSAPVLAAPPRHRPTGNLDVHLPTNDPDRPVIERIGVVSLTFDSTLDLVGAPFLEVVGEGWRGEQISHWIPVWRNRDCAVTLLAPHGERGAALRIEPKSGTPIEIRGSVERLMAGRFSEEELDATFLAGQDAWTASYTLAARVGRAVLAVALRPDRKPQSAAWGTSFELRFAAGEPLTLYIGIGPEVDGARTSSVHLARIGWYRLLERTEAKLRSLAAGGPRDEALSAVYRRNLFFGYHYAQATAMEGDTVLLTSRSPHYYVSGAYWARDALLWFFPLLLRVDPERARTVLEAAFARWAAWPGEHAQYLSGPPLYPGFELDQAAAYPLALARYVESTADRDVLERVSLRLRVVLERIARERHPEYALYRTFLSPTDDPIPFPYLVYDNALLSCALARLAPLLSGNLADWAAAEARQIRAALFSHGTIAGPFGTMFAFAFEPGGERVIGDEPAGSASLLAHLGFCSDDEAVFRATVEWIHSAHNPYHFDRRFCGEGSAHFPFPSGFSLANRILVGREPWKTQASRILREAALDVGLVPESYDPETGQVRTGAGFATLAAFVAYALQHGE